MKKLGLFFIISLIYPQRFSENDFVQKLSKSVSKKSTLKNLARDIAHQKFSYDKKVYKPRIQLATSDVPSDQVKHLWMGESLVIRRDLAYVRRQQWRGETILAQMGAFYIIQPQSGYNETWPFVVQNQYGEYYGFHPKIRLKTLNKEDRYQFEQDYALELEQEISPLNLVYYKVDSLTPERVLEIASNTQIRPELVKILRR
jgi:hypothetical protein